jgi:hypothetical protein
VSSAAVSEPARELRRSDSWLDSVFTSFENRLLNENYSPETVRGYGVGLKNLFAFLRARGVDDLADLNRQLLEDWQTSLRERVPPLKRRAAAASTRRLRASSSSGQRRSTSSISSSCALSRASGPNVAAGTMLMTSANRFRKTTWPS